MFILLISAVSAVSSIRVGLNNQYFNQLGQEAAESGVAYATFCLRSNNYTVTWTGKSLTPATDCAGNANGKSPYIMDNGDGVRTTFTIGNATVSTGGYVQIQASGKAELVRTSSGLPWQSYQQTMTNVVRYSDAPKISGGAGWKTDGHIGAIVTADGQTYAYGANSQGQVLGTTTPTLVSYPTKMSLPTTVTRVQKMITSGQGASFLCIIGDTGQVFCQGASTSTGSLMPQTPKGWFQFGLPGGLTAVDISISGYGADALCVLASNQQAYCAGENNNGSLGVGNAAYIVYPLTTPQLFVAKDGAGAQLPLRKIVTRNQITCGITTANDMYCAGRNTEGALAGPALTGYPTPIKYPMPNGRKVQDVVISYHADYPVVHVLATDGSIWGSGPYTDGVLGNGQTSGNTGTTQAPAYFTDNQADYSSGSIFWNQNSNKCVDNASNIAQNGNRIALWDCGPANFPNQTWMYSSNKQLINLGTGMCLDDPGNSTTPGTKVQLYTCNGTPAQQFELPGGTAIFHPASNLCVDALNFGTANDTTLQLQTCSGNSAQRFTTWPGINPWQGMIAGTDHFCAIRKDTWSGMWCAGTNTYGQLANVYDMATNKNFGGTCQAIAGSGHQMFNVNLPNGAKVDVTKLSSEWQDQFLSTMVIATDGQVYGSGRNQYGKLGSGSLGASAGDFQQCTTVKYQLPAGVTAVDMSTRDEYTTYVLGSDGKVYAAGYNINGQVGDGTTIDRATPVEVQIPRTSYSY
jgi:alpha-tubulin suppressor-like RCC1 family protein